jgi:short-subunit dehydrogenase
MSLPDPHPNSLALVTGASSGIGEQFARQLAQRGHRVVLVARTETKLNAMAQELDGAVAVPTDLAVAEDRDRLAARVAELGGDVDVLVNCAGYGIYEPFVSSGREREVAQVRLLVEAIVDLIARYLPGMVERRRGAVINVSSTAGFQALPYNAGYAAAKGHVLLLSEALHMEVKDAGVTVTAVCPGPVPSGFQEASDASYFAAKLPKFTFVDPARVARDSLRAADRGKISVIPGGAQVRMAYGPNRKMPRWAVLRVSKRMMARG